MDNTSNSKDLILRLLDEISIKKQIYRKKMVQLKKIDNITEAVLVGCGAISVSSLFVTVATINPVTLIVGSVFASINTIGSVVKQTIDVKAKFESAKTTVNQLSDLDRETRAVLSRNNLEKKDLQHILDDMIHRLSLIEDTSLPLALPIQTKDFSKH
jgi:hypothetical protein